MTHWLYPTDPRGDFYLLDDGDVERAVAPEVLWELIEERPDRVDPWVLSTGYNLIQDLDSVWVYSCGQRQELVALARVVGLYYDDEGQHYVVLLAWDLAATRALRRRPLRRRYEFDEVPYSVRRANPATARVLDAWLADQREACSEPGAPTLLDDEDVRSVADRVLGEARRALREQLVSLYGGRCAVTGDDDHGRLRVAHLAPEEGVWSLDPTNALLLRDDLAVRLEEGLVGIDAAHRLVVDASLAGTDIALLHGAAVALPVDPQDQPHPQLLALHLEAVRPLVPARTRS